MIKVAAGGTFDLLHEGHREFLRKARDLGDYLLVVVLPDTKVYVNKKRFPQYGQEQRKKMVAELPYVNEVAVDSLSWGLESVLNLKPDIFVFDDNQDTIWERGLKEYLQARGVIPEYVRISEKFTDLRTRDQRKLP